MSKNNPVWFAEVSKILKQFPDAVIDHDSNFFDVRPRVAIRINSLDGLGVIHRLADNEPFSFCVFEPSKRESTGFAEVFERQMHSVDELPIQIAAWQKFRSTTNVSTVRGALESYTKIVQKTLREKQKLATQFKDPTNSTLVQRFASVGIDVDLGALGNEWPRESQTQLQQDVHSINPELLAWHLPCDDTGRWILKRRVPLFRYDRDKRRMLDACLVVVLPEKRSGRAMLTTDWLNAESQSARLDATPEYFDDRLSKDFKKMIIGGELAKLLDLQYAGKFAKACKIVGLELDDSIVECLATKRVASMCTCCGELDEQLLSWSAFLTQTLLSMNLAVIIPLVARDQAKRSRPRTEPIPIVSFPLQRHIQKANLAIDIRNPKKPRLTIETTGSMNWVPIPLWRRPIECDALHQKFTDMDNLPNMIRTPFA